MRSPPQIDDVVLVVSSVQVHVKRIQQQECEQDQQNLHRLFPSVYKVPVEDVRRLR